MSELQTAALSEVQTSSFIPTSEMAATAQYNYDHPGSSFATLGDLHRRSTEYYYDIGLFDHDPIKARYMRQQVLWLTSLAPITHAATIDLARRALPLIRSGQSFFDNIPPGETLFDYQANSIYKQPDRKPFTAERLNFVYVAGAWAASSAWQLTVEGQYNRAQVPEFAWGSYQALHGDFCKFERQYRGFRRCKKPGRHFVDFLAESSDTTVELLDLYKAHFAPKTTASECNAAFLGQSEEVAWSSSVSSGFFKDRIAKHGLPSARACPFAKKSDGIWGILSLKNGRWVVPRRCVADFMMRSPDSEAREIVAELRERCGLDPKVEEVSAAWIRLVVDSYVAKETLWIPPIVPELAC